MKNFNRIMIMSAIVMIAATALWAQTGCPVVGPCFPDPDHSSQTWSYYFNDLDTWTPVDPSTNMHQALGKDEMRIIFLGSCIPPTRKAQAMMSVFVEVGDAYGQSDAVLFDCGSGMAANAAAMGIPFGKLDKVFITHLHGDHMSDLTHLYCFGPASDRKSPLYVWGPGRSGVKNPGGKPEYYADGVVDMCKAFRKAWRWHSESFSFLPTNNLDYTPPSRKDWHLPQEPEAVDGDKMNDGYALVPISLDWKKGYKHNEEHIAYWNEKTGVKITYFPVIHCRQGSVGYKLEWNGLTMIYTSDTRPETESIYQACNNGNGVDVFIHEMVVPPDVWSFKQMGLPGPPNPDTQPTLYKQYQFAVESTTTVQKSSHTPQGAFGYLMNQISPQPKLTVATHFPVADDTVACALNSVQAYHPDAYMDAHDGNLTWSFDLMTITMNGGINKTMPHQYRSIVSDYTYGALNSMPGTQGTAKYHDKNDDPDPTKQLDKRTFIDTTDGNGNCNYREDGY